MLKRQAATVAKPTLLTLMGLSTEVQGKLSGLGTWHIVPGGQLTVLHDNGDREVIEGDRVVVFSMGATRSGTPLYGVRTAVRTYPGYRHTQTFVPCRAA